MWTGYVENETTCGRVRLSLQNSWVLHESGLPFWLVEKRASFCMTRPSDRFYYRTEV